MRIPPMLIATALLSGCVSIDRLPERERAALFCARDTLKAHGASEVEFVTGLGDLPLVIRYAHAGREGRRHTSALEITEWRRRASVPASTTGSGMTSLCPRSIRWPRNAASASSSSPISDR